jgi:serine/threonine-protein kinase HipA
MSPRQLTVYWDQRPVGQLSQNQAGALSFVYTPDFLNTAPLGISVSLPLQEEAFIGPEVKAFFSGLLPDENLRVRLAKYLGVSDKNTFALIKEIGGECAGALALYPDGHKPETSLARGVQVLSEKQLQKILQLLKKQPLLVGEKGVRLSLAGAQSKLAVGFQDNQVCLMKYGQPTTHILKPLIDDVDHSVHNEFFCMQLARRVEFAVPEVAIHFVEQTPYYLVARYDRLRVSADRVERLHQEDFCQALGIAPEFKYQREGGPGIAHCQKLLLEHSAQPARNQIEFLDRIIFNYLIGNADAHGKNFSLLYQKEKRNLAPAYDLLCTAIYPGFARNMAMKIGSVYDPHKVFQRHWETLVPETRSAQRNLMKLLTSLAQRVIDEAPKLKAGLEAEGLPSPVYKDIIEVIKARTVRVLGF